MVGINRGSILYAQKMANEKYLEEYDFQKVLDRKIVIQISYAKGFTPDCFKEKRKLAEINCQQELPFKCIIKIHNNGEPQKLFIEGHQIYQDLSSMEKLNVKKLDKFVQCNEQLYNLENEEQIEFLDDMYLGVTDSENDTIVDNTWKAKDMKLSEDAKNIIVIFTIDTNGIYEIEFTEAMPENFLTTDDFLQAYCSTANSKCFQTKDISIVDEVEEKYIIPKDIFKNDESIDAVGIDLGTTRCCVAVNRRNGIQTAPLDNTGERLLPSFVAYDEENVKCGQVVVDRLRNFANSTAFDVKRLIGKTLEDIKLDNSWGFEIIAVNNKPKIQVQGPVRQILKHPEEISAALLKQIKRKTEEFQGKPLTEAVITVPASFDKAQKDSTLGAALITGWTKVHLLPEPIAAAFAYFINRPIPDNSTVLLFDLGGGTLDICIFKIVKRQIEIIGRNGDSNLGGRDFDNILVDFFKRELKKRFNIEVPENKKCKLMLRCQEIKHTLTVVNEDSLDVEDIGLSKDDDYIKITKNEFENLSLNLMEKLQTCINTALTKTNLTADKMDKVLYVGGGCRMPMIRGLLHETFSHAEHCCEEHPDEVVAIGAAYYAFYLTLQKGGKCSVM